MSLFVDTSAWYAAADRKDASHARAKAALTTGDRLVTTDHVLLETWTLLRYRLGRPAAQRFFEGIRRGAAALELTTASDVEYAWGIGLRFPDQDFSFTDRTSFAVMERLKILRVASFDSDFAVYRFGSARRRAFEVVR